MLVRSKSFVLLAAFFLLIFAYPVSDVQAKKLRMANWLPPFHHMTATLADWAEEVKKASGGTLEIEVLKTGLGKPPGQYDLAKNGVVDLSYGVPGYTPGRFPIMRAMELPFISPDGATGSAALWDWYTRNGIADKEYKDTKLILAFVHGPGVLHSKTQVRTLEDLNGLKLRVGGGGVEMSRKLGAVPVAMPAPKSHESLQKGTTTGALFPWESVKGFRLINLVKYHLEFPGGLYTTPFFLVMNKKAWNSLSAEHKAVMTKMGGIWGSRFIGQHWDDADVVGKKASAANGNVISVIGSSELERWRSKTQFMAEEWMAKADKAGYNGKALLADLRATVKKHSK